MLYFSIILFRNCKYVSLFLSICPGSLLDLMLLEYLISLCDLSKKLQSFNLCECVRVSLSAWVCVYTYKYDKSKQCFNCHMHNTIHIVTFEMWQNFKSSWTEKFKSLLLIYITQIFTCFKFCYNFSSIKILYTLKRFEKRIFIGIYF